MLVPLKGIVFGELSVVFFDVLTASMVLWCFVVVL